MSKKEKLKVLKAGLLATTLCLTLSACKKTEEKNEATVFFIQGKALIYEEGYDVAILDSYSSIGNSMIHYEDITFFSAGVEAIQTKSVEDAYELAVAIVGEENIIYMDYEADNIQLTYSKK